MYLMTGYIQCIYLFACEQMSLWLINVGIILRTNVASVFSDTRKVKVFSLPETIKEKSSFRAKALRR